MASNNKKHPEESERSVDLREKLNTLFRMDQVLDDNSYIIPFSQRQATAIRAASITTAKKMIESGIIQEYYDNDKQPYFGIPIPKRYGLTNKETMQLQTGLSGTALANYFELRADLLTSGFREDEVDGILSNPRNYDKLTLDQKRRAFEFLKEAQANQSKDLTDITGIISSRLIPEWDMSDTNNLPEALINEFTTFINHERNQWVNSDQTPKPTEALTTTDVEQKV